MVGFLLKVVVISLSGVLAPGPMTAATVVAGTRQRHAGALVAIGHGLVEFPLVLLTLVGVGQVLQRTGVRVGIGLAGGAFLVLMGLQMLATRQGSAEAGLPRSRHPITTGVVLTGANPYFLVWWATVGLALATQAAGLGLLVFGVFVVLHWLCDLVWLELLSAASHRGTKVLGERSQRAVLVICGGAMLFFGAAFLRDALRLLSPA
ncbi:MAG: LysE family transporter [Armatimonadetes bacterium]|jgi:threonine/homoserine/homoserine lactone efflux protein|nr:LysE family transporter [Armatimonadota bacterium]